MTQSRRSRTALRRDSKPIAIGPKKFQISKRSIVDVTIVLGSIFIICSVIFGCIHLYENRPSNLRRKAIASFNAGRPREAAERLRIFNQTNLATVESKREEARAWLSANRARDAEKTLIQAIHQYPTDPLLKLMLLEIERVEDRIVEAIIQGDRALSEVDPLDRILILRGLTITLLDTIPDERAREKLRIWIQADPEDNQAEVALLKRMASDPMAGDVDRPTRIARLKLIIQKNPSFEQAYEALAIELAASGLIDEGRSILDRWPDTKRDARYDRLKGRWELEFNNHPDRAVPLFERVVAQIPHDKTSWFRLSRAYKAVERERESRLAAERVAQLVEILDPRTLSPRLTNDFERLDDPESKLDLAEICDKAGFVKLAKAWREEAATPRHDSL